MEEIWKDIEGYEGLYQISSLGKIKNKEGKILKTRKDTGGYLLINLFKNKKNKTFRVHRLVANAFILNPENKMEVDHIDTNKENNNVKNLKWVTSKENSNNKLTLKHFSESQKGKVTSEDTKNKLRKINTIPIYCKELNKVFFSIRECARELSLDPSAIAKVCKGKYKQTGGYHFQYCKYYYEKENNNEN